jgi:hypothetical protein
MRRPTQVEWNRLKEQYGRGPQKTQQSAAALPEDLFLPDDYGVQPAARADSEKPPKRRRFRRLDEPWAERLLADTRTPPWIRLAIVLLAEADFHRRIKVSASVEKDARLTRRQKRPALEYLEQLGFIAAEWRGRGRAPIATPLHLTGRPGRK